MLPNIPEGVEVNIRSVPGGRPVFILINHTDTSQHIVLLRAMQNILADHEEATIDLKAHDVAVLTAVPAR